MNKKVFGPVLVAILIAVVVFSALPSSNAQACGEECPPPPVGPFPICGFHPVGGTYTGEAPFQLTVVNDGSAGDVIWYWGDNTLQGSGYGASHVYQGPGNYSLTQKITFAGQPAGNYCTLTEIVKVLPAQTTATVTPDPTSTATPQSPVAPSNGNVTTSGDSCSITGVDNGSIAICGDNNTVTIDNSTVQPAQTIVPVTHLSFWDKLFLPLTNIWRFFIATIQGKPLIIGTR